MAVERIIGVDFGTSTSVVRVKQYEDGVPMGDKLLTLSVVFNMGSTMVPTLVQRMLPPGEEVYYGYDAEIPRKKTELYSNFKVQLEDEDAEVRSRARQLTAEYFAYLADVYRTQDSGGHFAEHADIQKTIVSYPVKWSEETRQFMVETAKAAGFPNVEGMDEAQAAIYAVTVQNTSLLVQKGYFQENVPVNILLADMGAGTTDLVLCRHTPGAEPKTDILCTWPQKGGALFGGSEVDELLKRFILSSVPEEAVALVSKKLDSEKYKTWKETVVSPSLLKGDTVDYFSALDDLLEVLDLEAEFKLDREAFENLASDYLRQFPVLIKDCLNAADMGEDEVDLVILTGGHSQWYFAKEILSGQMNRFGDENIHLGKIVSDPGRIIPITRPQETVALGLVYSPMKVELRRESLVRLPGKAPTCMEIGQKACWCRESDKALFADEEGTEPLTLEEIQLPALGHHYEWQERNGKKIHVCSRCGAVGQQYAIQKPEILNPEVKVQPQVQVQSPVMNEVTPESEFELLNDGENYVLKKYLGKRSNVVIPSEVRGRKIVRIASMAFVQFNKAGFRTYPVESVTIPRSVTVIEDKAFLGCKKLKRVMLHQEIKKIGNYAFYGCFNLSWIDFGVGNTTSGIVFFPQGLQLIGIQAFSNKQLCYLREVTLSKDTKVKNGLLGRETFDLRDVAVFYYEDTKK